MKNNLKKISEKEILKTILDWAKYQKDLTAIRINVIGVPLPKKNTYRPSAHVGISDIIICIRGKILCVECKSPRGTLSHNQKIFKEKIEKTGGIYIIARSLEDVTHIVKIIRENTTFNDLNKQMKFK